MPKVAHLDPSTPMMAQLQQKSEGPVTVVNTFFVPRDMYDEFMKIWQEDARIMKSQPGFISMQMHRGTAGSQLMVNVAVWESTEALAAAHAKPEFRKSSASLPDSVVAHPHIFQKIAVEGVCVS